MEPFTKVLIVYGFLFVVGVLVAVHEHRRRAALTAEQRRAEDEAADRDYEETGGI